MLALLSFAVLTGAPATPTIFVDAGDHTAPIAAAVEQELGLGTVTATRTAALLRVEIWVDQAFNLRIVAGTDSMVADRTFPLEDGLKPALRAAVLLIVDAATAHYATRAATVPAVEATAPMPPEPPQPVALEAPPDVRPPRWRMRWSVSGDSWSEPASILTGVATGGQVRLGPIWVGAQLGLEGLGCCALSSENVDGRVWAVEGLIDIEWPIARVGPMTVAVLARGGVRWTRFDGRALFVPRDETAVRSTEQTASAWASVGQAGGMINLQIQRRVFLHLALGAEVRGGGLAIRPPPPAGDRIVVDDGPWGGWLQAGAGVHFF